MFVFFLDYQEIIKSFFVFIRLGDIDEVPVPLYKSAGLHSEVEFGLRSNHYFVIA
jgi:hypothetical protein